MSAAKTPTDGYTQSYGYNRIGNIISTTLLGAYSYNPSGANSVRPHAVLTAGSNRYSYDANGNQLTRVEVSGTQRITYTQSWDRENRLAVVTNTVSGQVSQYFYDGDGNRVKKLQNGQATVYVGAIYEKNLTTGVTTTYYFAGGQRLALRQGGVLSYLVADHLGSTSLTLDANGNKVGELKYYPYGETRSMWGSTSTDRRFTGQRQEDSSLGSLYDFNARFYSPYLNRWIQPDTIVPDPANPQTLNRYSYVNNRPLNFTDPTGNFSEDEIMKTFHVKTWEEVLAIFGKGGLLDGRWGWLETLRRAEIGDYVDIRWDTSLLPEGHPSVGDSFRGWFTKDNDGQVLLGNRDAGYYFNQLKAGLYGKQYDLTHYIREGVYGALTCVEGLACDTSHFSTAAIHKPYLHQKVKWDKFVKEPVATMELVEMGAITAATTGLAGLQVAVIGAACANPAALFTCAGTAALMSPNVVLASAAAYGVGHATLEYFNHEFTAITP